MFAAAIEITCFSPKIEYKYYLTEKISFMRDCFYIQISSFCIAPYINVLNIFQGITNKGSIIQD